MAISQEKGDKPDKSKTATETLQKQQNGANAFFFPFSVLYRVGWLRRREILFPTHWRHMKSLQSVIVNKNMDCMHSSALWRDFREDRFETLSLQSHHPFAV